jgi:dolichyl-phosphate-mannose--protein O-mannosyl transferase
MMMAFVGFAVQFLPWVLVTRVCFIYHYFTAVPFIIFMIVYVIKNHVEDGIISKKVMWIYLALVFVLFVIFYPVLTAREVSREYINNLRWFSTWSF